MTRCITKRKLLTTLATALAITLTGCSGGINTQAAFERYTTQFNTTQSPVLRSIARPDGYKINLREFGVANRDNVSTPSSSAKPTFIMMHGFPDNQRLYDLLAPAIAKTHHVVTFDFLGWGESDKPSGHLYNVASQRADLEAVIAALKLTSVVIVVHDLSGHVGIDWALDNEANTQNLVLLNTYYNNMPTLVAPEAIEFYANKSVLRDIATWGAMKAPSRFQGNFEGQISKFFSNDAAKNTFVPVFSHVAPSIRPAFFSSTAVLWEEVAARDKKVPRVKAFKKPVQIIFGVDDPYLNRGVATEFSRLFSLSRVHLIAEAGHYVQLDRPDEVAAIMLSNLQYQ